MFSGNIRMFAPASKKKLNSQIRLIELLNNKKIGISRKRQGLSGSSGLKLLKLIQPSVSNHLKKRHGLHSRAEEFIHITAEEYSSLLSLRKTAKRSRPASKLAASSEALESTNPRKWKSKFGVSISLRMCSVEREF